MKKKNIKIIAIAIMSLVILAGIVVVEYLDLIKSLDMDKGKL